MLEENIRLAFQRSRERLVLGVLQNGEHTGYEIVAKLLAQGDIGFLKEEGAVYAILHLLENRGDIVSTERRAKELGVRRYYRLTKQGVHQMQVEKRHLSRVKTKVKGGSTCVRKK